MRYHRSCPACLALVLFVASTLAAQQLPDADFDATVNNPAYAKDGPRVLFDEAHHNFHTAEGRYKPFADLIRNDGYRITSNKHPFTADLLKEHDILIIANALGSERMSSPEAAGPAFSAAECDAVRDWVRGGGALLLITDHHPMGSAANALGERFGVLMSRGSSQRFEFTAEKGLAPDHPIVRGRSEAEAVKKIRSFTGQTIKGPEGSVSLMVLQEDAQEQAPRPGASADGPAEIGPVVYPSQGVAMEFGKGRVVVLGEAAMLTAQVIADKKFGMNQPDTDNRQFALNMMHWLSRLLP